MVATVRAAVSVFACLPAADEKYNFERLQATTVLNRQPLLCPQLLDLSPTEELTVRWAWGMEVAWQGRRAPQGRLDRF